MNRPGYGLFNSTESEKRSFHFPCKSTAYGVGQLICAPVRGRDNGFV